MPQADYGRTTSPGHAAAGFPTECQQCHQSTATTWGNGFSHQTSRFPLTGAHAAVSCAQCHQNGNYQLKYTDCYTCHATNFAQPVNPNHVQGQFSHSCTNCHGITAWKPATFSHSATAFPLTGAHQTVACSQCHVNGNYQLQYTGCYTCLPTHSLCPSVQTTCWATSATHAVRAIP